MMLAEAEASAPKNALKTAVRGVPVLLRQEFTAYIIILSGCQH